jgi:probable phosphoglycerate mutase
MKNDTWHESLFCTPPPDNPARDTCGRDRWKRHRSRPLVSDRVSVSLYLIRHGETAWSLSGQHTGRTDIALTAHGEDQARGLRPFLETIPFTHVLTSPAIRAGRTCALAGLGSSARIDPDLAEWDYGDCEGKRTAEIQLVMPGWNVFRDGCPGGESPIEVGLRADRLIARLRGLDGTVALFSHGQFGSVLAARWIGLPVVEGQHFHLDPASVSALACNPSHPDVSIFQLWNRCFGRAA